VSRRNTSFYHAFLVLPPDRRAAIVAVWDFCRAVDDAVDERVAQPGSDLSDEGLRAEARADLALWRRELAACYEEGRPTRPEARALVPHIGRFGLPRDAFERVIDGVEMDLDRRRYEDFETLRQYCLRVASAVGLISIEIFGYRDSRARRFAIDLGLALQLTNIVRDVGVDLARGRIYLPLEDLRRFSCTEEDLRAGRVSDRVRALLGFEVDRARGYYASAARALPAIDRRRLVAARIMGAIYADILTRIERSGYEVFSGVQRAPAWRRALIAARVWAATMIGL